MSTIRMISFMLMFGGMMPALAMEKIRQFHMKFPEMPKARYTPPPSVLKVPWPIDERKREAAQPVSLARLPRKKTIHNWDLELHLIAQGIMKVDCLNHDVFQKVFDYAQQKSSSVFLKALDEYTQGDHKPLSGMTDAMRDALARYRCSKNVQ